MATKSIEYFTFQDLVDSADFPATKSQILNFELRCKEFNERLIAEGGCLEPDKEFYSRRYTV